MDKKQPLYQLTEKLETLAIGGKLDGRIDEKNITHIQYNNIPLWWFYQIRFMRDALPKQFDNFEKILSMENANKLRLVLHIEQKKAQAKILAKGLAINEALKRRAAKDPETRTADVVFLAHSTALEIQDNTPVIDRINRVYELAQKDKDCTTELLVIDPISKRASQQSRELPNFFHSYIDKKTVEDAEAHAKKLNKQWKDFKKKLFKKLQGKEKHFLAFFEPALDFFFSKEMIQVTITYYETFKKILKQKKAKALIIYSPAGVLDRCAIKAADDYGIPTIRLTHGLGISATPWTYPKTFHVLANNAIEKTRYEKLGAPKNNIHITGPVFIDGVHKSKKKKRKSNKKTILFCTAPIVRENIVKKDAYLNHIKKVLEELHNTDDGNTHIIIKLHPIEDDEGSYQKIVNELGAENMEVVQGTLGKKSLYDCIYECDVFISFFSTTLFEANLLDKPTILIELYDRIVVDPENTFHDNSKAVLKLPATFEKGVLKDLTEKVLHDPELQTQLTRDRAQFIEDFFYKNDNKAPERAVRKIKEIIEL
jgi:hypothetical protein